MSKNQKLCIILMTISNIWAILVPVYGSILNQMAMHSGPLNSQTICVIAYVISISISTILLKGRLIKNLANISVAALIILSIVIWFFGWYYSIVPFLLLGLISGLLRASMCMYPLFRVQYKNSLSFTAIVLLGTYIFAYFSKFIILFFGFNTLFVLIILLLASTLLLNNKVKPELIDFKTAEDAQIFPYKMVTVLGVIFFVSYIIYGVVQNSAYPKNENSQTSIAFFLEFLPQIVIYFIICLAYKKIKKMIIIITSSVSLIGISILIYAIFGRNSVSNVGFDSSFALIDILTYSIILTVSIQYQTNVRVFKSLLIISCFGTLVGEFVGKELARNLPANSIIFPVFMLAIVFIFVFTMPWTTKYINVMLELRTKPDMPPANYEEQRIANNPLPADLFGDFIRRAKTLTPAERTIFDYYLEGKSNKEIISLMYISLSTLKTHNSHIYAKLNVSSRDELSLYAELIRKSGKLADIK